MDFEKRLKDIEGIASKLQAEDVGIKEGIALFEKSVVLTKECLDELNESRQKIEQIKQELDKLLNPIND